MIKIEYMKLYLDMMSYMMSQSIAWNKNKNRKRMLIKTTKQLKKKLIFLN
ncbi:MAG: hypothetical protein LKM44_03020 [Wolbachia endosymbiont of Meromenopon meropis]|nr:hypothetical protein [Wolbachia endosymbiont of Meromenopon meropis]